MSTTTVVSVQSTPCALENGAMELQRHQSHGSGNEVHRSFPNSTTPPTESVEATPPLDRATVACLISAGYAFFCAGINDGSLGPLIPYLLATYAINTSFVSIFYAVTFAGWLCAALTNTYLTSVLDTGAILAVGAGLQALAHALRVWLPPFSVFATAFFFATLGQGYQDTHANTFVSTVKNAPHRWLGFIHAMYMAGCLVGPFVATSVAAATQPSRWNLFYYFPLGLGSINILFTLWAFRRTVKFKRSVASETRQIRGDSGASEAETSQLRGHRALKEFKETLKLSSVWRLGLFFFFFLGVAITASGWVVTFLIDVRNGAAEKMGYVASGFSGGAFLGRLLLAEPTHKFGVRRMILLYILLCLAMQLCFWLIPDIIADAVAVSILGFFSGPFFASGISVGSQLFPERVKSSAISLVFVLGQIGGSTFPALTGIIAARAGVSVLQPMLVGLLVATGISWWALPWTKEHHSE